MSEILHHRAKVGALSRSRTPDDAELVAAKADLAKAKIDARIDELVAAAPPLTDEQRTRLAELLKPIRKSGADRKTVVAERLSALDGGADG